MLWLAYIYLGLKSRRRHCGLFWTLLISSLPVKCAEQDKLISGAERSPCAIERQTEPGCTYADHDANAPGAGLHLGRSIGGSENRYIMVWFCSHELNESEEKVCERRENVISSPVAVRPLQFVPLQMPMARKFPRISNACPTVSTTVLCLHLCMPSMSCYVHLCKPLCMCVTYLLCIVGMAVACLGLW
jgi:hypothetical protein